MSLIEGQRFEMHPATEQWMQGDRYATVVEETERGNIRATLDKSGSTVILDQRDIYKLI